MCLCQNNEAENPVTTKATNEARWGSEGQYRVVELEKNPQLMQFYNRIHNLLLEAGAVFNEPQFEGKNYTPHSTIQKHGGLEIGETVVLDNLAIVDMFPNQDGYQRKIAVFIDSNLRLDYRRFLRK